MKKIMFYAIFLSLIVSLNSCKKEKENALKNKVEVKNYIIDSKNSVIKWTAYKTTEKIPVAGVFKEVEITNNEPATNRDEILKGLEFEIPVSSIFSNDSIRDFKLVNFFFGVMENTLSLKGKFVNVENGKGVIKLNMNGISNDLPFNYEIVDDNISINSTMNLDNWKTQLAIESLNKVCNEKHKAADGISKTWSEVAIDVQVKTVLEK
jgi:YceI-like protein